MNPRLIFVTAGSQDEARVLAKALLESKLAACVNIIPGVESHYWWQGKLETASEWLLFIKSSEENFAAVCETIHRHHSYECPEIVSVAPLAVDPRYFQWWRSELKVSGF